MSPDSCLSVVPDSPQTSPTQVTTNLLCPVTDTPLPLIPSTPRGIRYVDCLLQISMTGTRWPALHRSTRKKDSELISPKARKSSPFSWCPICQSVITSSTPTYRVDAIKPPSWTLKSNRQRRGKNRNEVGGVERGNSCVFKQGSV